jgi:hypothetical protein
MRPDRNDRPGQMVDHIDVHLPHVGPVSYKLGPTLVAGLMAIPYASH